MKQLADIQKRFQDHLVDVENKAIYSDIIETNKVPAETRLHIYSNAYESRLIDCLAETYAALSKIMGRDAFYEMGQAYLTAYPSTFRSIRWFGDQLPTFLATHDTYGELAQLEWTSSLVFDAKAGEPISLAALTAISPDEWSDLTFTLHPSLYRLNCMTNAVDVWMAANAEQTLPELRKTEKSAWMFWRKGYECKHCLLPEDEAWAIDAIINQISFGEVCEGLLQWKSEEEVAMQAASFLKSWIQEELVIEFKR